MTKGAFVIEVTEGRASGPGEAVPAGYFCRYRGVVPLEAAGRYSDRREAEQARAAFARKLPRGYSFAVKQIGQGRGDGSK